MRQIILLITALTIYGCEKQCKDCVEKKILDTWNINNMTDSSDTTITHFTICEDFDVVDGINVIGEVREVESNIYERTTIEITCK